MGVIIITLWVRLFATASNTYIAGPTLRIIGEMFKQLSNFLVVEMCVTLAFSTLAQIWFGRLMVFRTISSSLETMTYAGLGYYDTAWFDDMGERRVYGIYFLMGYLVVNVLLLMNYVVAIMTDRYAALQESRLGLFYDGLISSMAEYKYDSHYGFLIANFLPFNVFNLLLAPLFIVMGRDQSLKKLNRWLMVIGYSPLAIIVTSVFFALNVLLLPFAYVIGILKKLQLLCTTP